jgi:hypothetical protein
MGRRRTGAVEIPLVQQLRHARSDSRVVRPSVLGEDRVSGTPWRSRTRARGGLGRAVALRLAAGHDEDRSHAAGVTERHGVVEARRKTGDGRPSYWAAPSTTIASGRAALVARPLPDPERWRRPITRRRPCRRRGRPARARTVVGRSAAVALLVLLARPAPARVVAPDPLARSGCSPGRAPRPACSRGSRRHLLGAASRVRVTGPAGRARDVAAPAPAAAVAPTRPGRTGPLARAVAGPRAAPAPRRRRGPAARDCATAPRPAPGAGGW